MLSKHFSEATIPIVFEEKRGLGAVPCCVS